MSSSTKNILIGILISIIALLSFKLLMNKIFEKKEHAQINSTIIVNRIEKVMKLITVEGNYSELMTYKDFDYIDFPGFRKDAILKINAKVSVGYNLEKMKIATNEKDKIISIQQMPKPEILSVDSDIKFENMSSGLFTNFSAQELSKLNALAKEKIKQKALNEALIQQAEEQKNDILDLMFYMAKQNGYKIEIEGKVLQPISIKNIKD